MKIMIKMTRRSQIRKILSVLVLKLLMMKLVQYNSIV